MGPKNLTRNFLLKFFSLAVALIMFLFVNVESATPVDVDFPIEYRTAPEMMIIEDPPTILHTTLQGPWANLRMFETSEMPALVIDLTEVEPGTLRHRIDTEDLDAPGGMSVVSIRPAEIEVTLDRRIERLVPVEPDISERPAFGYEILSVRIDPPRVRAVGPMTKMRTLDFVSTRPIDVNGREDDITIKVELRQPGPGLRLLDREVEVLVEIREEFVQRTFPDVKIELENAPKGSRLSPDTTNITLKGPQRLVDKLVPKTLKLYVDARTEVEDGQSRFEKPVVLRDPPERTLLVPPVPKVVVQLPKSRRRRR